MFSFFFFIYDITIWNLGLSVRDSFPVTAARIEDILTINYSHRWLYLYFNTIFFLHVYFMYVPSDCNSSYRISVTISSIIKKNETTSTGTN